MAKSQAELGKNYAFRVDDDWEPGGEPARGNSTASPLNVRYRVGSISKYLSGRWLDYGCADGGYTDGLLDGGASSVVGVDVEAARVEEARRRGHPADVADFEVFDGTALPFDDGSFDGAFVNEVMEHVADERQSLAELRRVIKPGGHLVVISPNRWFPFEGHTVRIGKWTSRFPTPVIPWLPGRLTRDWVDARNYWPFELSGLVERNGFTVVERSFIWPVFEVIPWLPARWITYYQRHISVFSRIPGLRRFGVSNLVVGVRN